MSKRERIIRHAGHALAQQLQKCAHVKCGGLHRHQQRNRFGCHECSFIVRISSQHALADHVAQVLL